jgi:hypothetical protein
MSSGKPRPGLLRTVLTALGVMALAASGVSSTAGAQALPVKPELLQHTAKSKRSARSITLRPVPVGRDPAARTGPISPYERAAEQRALSGQPPPGHPVVRRQAAPAPN